MVNKNLFLISFVIEKNIQKHPAFNRALFVIWLTLGVVNYFLL